MEKKGGQTIRGTVFKVIGNVEGVAAYVRSSSSSRTGGSSDWSALYAQFNAQNALETAGYRFEVFKEVLLIEVEIECSAVIERDEIMSKMDVSGLQKATFLKEKLDIPNGELLMEALGKRGLCLICLESQNEYELVIPHLLMDAVLKKETTIYRFRPNEFGSTGFYKREGEDQWKSMPKNGILFENVQPKWLIEMFK